MEAKHDDSMRMKLAPFADMMSGELRCIDAIQHRIELTPNSHLFLSALYRAGPKVRELEELELQKQLKADLI